MSIDGLAETANSAAKAKGIYLRQSPRLQTRGGSDKILVASTICFPIRVCYNKLADLYLDELNKHHLTRNLFHRLERRCNVTLEQKTA